MAAIDAGKPQFKPQRTQRELTRFSVFSVADEVFQVERDIGGKTI